MNIWKRISLVIFLAVAIPFSTFASELRTVRVAFLPELFGFYEMEENGGFSGYNHDYLMTLVQHTKWDIEYVVIQDGYLWDSVQTAYDLLEAGEIDLFGPFFENNPKIKNYEIGEKSYSVCRYNFYAAGNNYALTANNYFYQDSIKVALAESTDYLSEGLFRQLDGLGIELDITPVENRVESLQLLLSEAVDGIIYADVSENSSYLEFLTTVYQERIYFAATKGQTQLLAELDEAIGKLEVIEPNMHQKLFETYFGARYIGDFLFTDAEHDFLTHQDTFRVGLLDNTPPYQFTKETGEKAGITLEIMGKLEEILGITFDVLWYQNPEDLYAAMIQEEIDIFATLPHDYDLIHHLNVVLTTPYLSSGVYWLRNGLTNTEPSYLYHYVSSNIPFVHDDDLSMILNLEDCLKIMDETGEFSIFCDPHIAEYYMAHLNLKHIETQSVSNVLSEITFGIRLTMDESLVGMLNRAILYLDTYELDEIIYRNTTVPQEYTLEEFFQDYSMRINLAVIFISMIVLLTITRYAYKFRDLSRRDGMTKLYNSGYFHEYAEEKTPHLPSGALILVDIDYFKDVNDTHGHLAGDTIIKIVAEHMKEFTNHHGVLARLGGDEFVVLLEGAVSQESLEEISRKILDSLLKNRAGIPVTLSMGGYLFEEGISYQKLYKLTDEVLYQVKERGRNGFAFYNRKTMEEAKKRQSDCLNYDIFQEKVAHILSSTQEDTQHAMITIQIDGLENILEQQGEVAASEYLSFIGEHLKKQVKDCDLLGSQGENIFVMLVEFSGNDETLQKRMASMKRTLEQEVSHANLTLSTETSVRVALYPEHGTTFSELHEYTDRPFK